LDNSDVSREAFNIALRVASAGDCLYLVSILDECDPEDSWASKEHAQQEEEVKHHLRVLSEQCTLMKMRHAIIVISDDHIGKVLCKLANEYQIDCIIIARRDLGTFQRMVTSSISKYCVENAECNVLVAKRPYHNAPLPVAHNQQEVAAKVKPYTAESTNLTLPYVPKCANEVPIQPTPISTLKPAPFTVTPKFAPILTTEINVVAPATVTHPKPVLTEATKGYKQVREARIERDVEVHKLQAEKEKLEEMKKREWQQKLTHTQQLEEAERARRLAEENLEKAKLKQASKIDLQKVHKLEEEERKERVALLKEEEDLERATRKLESLRDLQRVRLLEEQEREERIKEYDARILQAREAREKESQEDLEKVKILEEQARQERIKQMKEEDELARFVEDQQSVQDLMLTLALEETARAEQILEIEAKRNQQKQESKHDLQEVKRLEEEERQRRMNPRGTAEHQDIRVIDRLEAEERLRRIKESQRDIKLEKQLSNQNRMMTEHLEEKERARRMKEETKNEERNLAEQPKKYSSAY